MDVQTTTPIPQTDGDDLSKKTIVVLALLSVAISIIGVIAMVYEVSAVRGAPVILENGGTTSGKASFTLLGNQEATVPGAMKSSGMATFEIGRRK